MRRCATVPATEFASPVSLTLDTPISIAAGDTMTTTKTRPLKWRTVINNTRQVADGRYPGWTYVISKDGSNNWTAYFEDEIGRSQELLRGVSFARARKASFAHHDHPAA